MENFTAYNPTKLIFGKECINKLHKESGKLGKRALIIIGKGSVKKNGILDAVTAQLTQANIEYTLYEGIKSNPIYQDADKAVAQAKEFGVDMIVAVGGGSVIDTAKAVAMGYYVEHSVWDFFSQKLRPKKALPLFAVLTLAATGSEMNPITVLQNDETGVKIGIGSPLVYPTASFLDPEYTYSVPKTYTSYGVADLIAHTLEVYFEPSDSPLSNHVAGDIIKLAMEYGEKVMENPNDYDARANIMWLATTALNGSLAAGKRGGDWGVHNFEHTLSVLFDVPHGAGLSIVYPAWLKSFKGDVKEKLDFLAKKVVGEDKTGEDFIAALESFFEKISTPTRLSQMDISGEDKMTSILENLEQNKVSGNFFKMDKERYENMLQLMA